jgi:hypothetical protein
MTATPSSPRPTRRLANQNHRGENTMRNFAAAFVAVSLLSPFAAFAEKEKTVDWNAMDANKDGYITPQEMVDYFKKTGVYK